MDVFIYSNYYIHRRWLSILYILRKFRELNQKKQPMHMIPKTDSKAIKNHQHNIKYHVPCLKCLDITKVRAPAFNDPKAFLVPPLLSSRPTSPLPYMNDVIDGGQD